MNKVELVGAVASKSEISKKDVEKVINAFTNIVADALVDGDKVQLRSEEHTSELQSQR